MGEGGGCQRLVVGPCYEVNTLFGYHIQLVSHNHIRTKNGTVGFAALDVDGAGGLLERLKVLKLLLSHANRRKLVAL